MQQLIPISLYIATVAGAVGLLMMMPRGGRRPARIGGIIAAASLAGLWFVLHAALRGRFEALSNSLGGITEADAAMGLSRADFIFYYIFSFIAVGAAVRVITHTRAVYAALWFVMVVLSTAGLFLMLSAEFMAIAMVIIYGGAILVTYMFVLMLATQPTADDSEEALPLFERQAREPLAAVAAGFLLLAVLLTAIVVDHEAIPLPEALAAQTAAPTDAEIIETRLPDRSVASLPEGVIVPGADATTVTNTERVGLDLFESHPLAIELAGVILLISLIGAVVIAKTQVPGEGSLTAEAGEGGATVNPTEEPGPNNPQVLGSLDGGRG